MGGNADGLVAVDHDRAGAAADHVHDGAQGGAAARAVASEQRYQLSPADHHVDAMQNVGFAVERMQVIQPQLVAIGHGRHG